MAASGLGGDLFSDVNNYVQLAKDFYSQIGESNDFERDLGKYLLDGYMVSSPNGIIFGKPVRRDGGPADAQWWDDEENCDAWFVKFAAGEGMIREFIEAMPYQLPFIGWMRATKSKAVRYWNLKQILRRK